MGTIDFEIYSPPVVCSQNFRVIDEVFPYNDALGRPWIRKIDAITTAMHQKIYYLIPRCEFGQIDCDQTSIP